jgi:hypothetical protein
MMKKTTLSIIAAILSVLFVQATEETEKVTTWEYSLSVTGWTHAPVQFPNLLRDYYQDNRKVIAGSFLNGGVPAEWSRNAPTLYYWMKLLWNPEIESKAVFDEMCARMFGEGAEPARALLQLMIERFEKAEWPTRMGDAGQVSDAILKKEKQDS